MVRVLIIDDEEIIREIVLNSIDWEELGCEVVGTAENGEDGFKKVELLNPDLLIVDICMPGMDGLELVSQLRQNNYDCKVIILSSYPQFEYAQKAMQVGAFRYLLKPANPADLIDAISDACAIINKERAFLEELNNLEQKVAQIDEMGMVSQHQSTSANRKGYSRLVTLALDYINMNYASKDMGLKAVANEVFVSTWYLSKLIKRETGENFIKILTNVRLAHAKALLGSPQYKVYEIAAMVGFDDVPHFTKTFKSIVGISPLEYRRDYIRHKSPQRQDSET